MVATSGLPISDARHAIKILEEKLGQILSFRLGHAGVSPLGAYDNKRRQYAAEAFLSIAEDIRMKERCFASLVLTEVDIFATSTNYVFGLANLERGIAVVSSHRVHPSFWGIVERRDFFETQWGKVVTHEFGHTVGLLHCQDSSCVMKFSNSPSELYAKGTDFCKKCGRELQEALTKLVE
jgi:archaemetzincin